MKKLNNKTAKKGDTIFIVTPFNHHFNSSRNRPSVDTYNVEEWVIHSIGKKIMKLEDSQGLKGAQKYADSQGNYLTSRSLISDPFTNFFCFEEKEIDSTIEAIRANDNHTSERFEVVRIRLNF